MAHGPYRTEDAMQCMWCAVQERTATAHVIDVVGDLNFWRVKEALMPRASSDGKVENNVRTGENRGPRRAE